MKSEIKEDKLFVDVGAGVILKKGIGETKKVVEEQLQKLREMKLQISSQQENMNEELRNLIENLQEEEGKKAR